MNNPSESNFEPLEQLVIDDLDRLRVLADPLRSQIIELLSVEALTIKQVADRLGLASSKLYYHFNMLEKHQLIRVIETRMVANLMQKIYRAVATSYTVSRELLSFADGGNAETIGRLLASTLDTTREDVLRSFQARIFELEHHPDSEPRGIVLTRMLSRISESRADEFRERLTALVQEFDSADQRDEQAHQPYALTIAFYPSIYFGEPPKEDNDE